MFRPHSLCAASIAVALLWPALALADHRYAIVIGSNKAGQQSSAIYKELNHADDDALRMHLVLSSAGFRSQLFTTLKGVDTDKRFQYFRDPSAGPRSSKSVISVGIASPTYGNIVRALKKTISAINEATNSRPIGPRQRDQLFIYFSGHGDNNAIFLEDQSLTYDELTGILANVGDCDVHIMLDACMTTPQSDGGRLLASHPLFKKKNVHAIVGVTSQREALEWQRAKSGVMTYVWSSALMGAAILSDAFLTYDYLVAYVDTAFLGVVNPEAKMVPLTARQSRHLMVIDWSQDVGAFRELIVPADRDLRIRVFLGSDKTPFVETHLGKERKQDTVFRLPLTTGGAYEVEQTELRNGDAHAMTSRFILPNQEGPVRLDGLPPMAVNETKGAVDESLDRGLFSTAYDDVEYQRHLTWQLKDDLSVPADNQPPNLLAKSSQPEGDSARSEGTGWTVLRWTSCVGAPSLVVGGFVAQLQANDAFAEWSRAGNEVEYQAGQTRTRRWELARSISFGAATVSAAVCVVSLLHGRNVQ